MPTPEDLTELAKAANTAKEYADAILMQPLNQLGGILSDSVGYWRLKNQVRLILKTRDWLDSNGVDFTRVLPDIFVPLLEDGGNTSDPDLSDMFASLLSCHLDPDSSDSVHPSYSRVLAQLSPVDARTMVLYRSCASHKRARDVGLIGGPRACDQVSDVTGTSNGLAYLSCLNLRRLGVVELFGINKSIAPANAWEQEEFRITEYGIAFCDACHYHDADGTSTYAKQLLSQLAKS